MAVSCVLRAWDFEIFGRGGLFCGYVVVPLCGMMSVSFVRQFRVSFEMHLLVAMWRPQVYIVTV